MNSNAFLENSLQGEWLMSALVPVMAAAHLMAATRLCRVDHDAYVRGGRLPKGTAVTWPVVATSWGHLRLQDSRLELEKLAAVLLDTGQTSRC